MGVVYAAEDIRLGRPVALKFVPEDLAKDSSAVERLRSEARTASGLNHSNICTIYDIGEHEGRPFIVMELLKGQTLRERLAGGLLKIHDVVELGIQVADALDSAHNRGVIHRDIKPANLFVVDRGPVKILDFGLAKLALRRSVASTTDRPTMDQTGEGLTLGTVAYMSPEQVTGEQLDGRTDLFSLGVVLYECLTGHQPFTGKTSAVIFSAILTRAPVAPVIFNPELPLRLQEVVNNCLEKDRELRYADAAGLRADLKRVKRDLESGHSGITRLPGTAHTTSVMLSAGGTGAPEGASVDRGSSGSLTHGGGWRESIRGLALAAAVATVIAVAVALAFTGSFRRSPPAPAPAGDSAPALSESFVQGRLALSRTSLEAKDYRAAMGYAEEVLRAVPDQRDAVEIRDAAGAMIRRFDEAIARAREFLAAGDTEAAAGAINEARGIDASAQPVVELSARLVSQLRIQAEAARREAQRSRSAPPAAPAPRQRVTEVARGVAPVPRPPVEPPPVPRPEVPAPSPENPPAVAVAPPSAPRPPAAPEPLPSTQAVSPAAPMPADTREAARPTRSNESDEAAINRVVAAYARAIETKNLSLFRTVKPNLTSEEQRRIEEGFRAVASQQVSVTILSIEHRGSDAYVRLRRRDTIRDGGRQQTTESEQTMILTRAAAGWVIREIGR